MPKDIVVKIDKVCEQDVVIQFPHGQKWTVQYRNYDEGRGSVDILLGVPMVVNNWKGESMGAAPKVQESHIRNADQLMVMFD